MNDKDIPSIDDILSDYAKVLLSPHIDFISLQEAIDRSSAKAKALIQKREHQAQLALIEVFDRIPSNDVMNWKGLLKDSREVIKGLIKEIK